MEKLYILFLLFALSSTQLNAQLYTTNTCSRSNNIYTVTKDSSNKPFNLFYNDISSLELDIIDTDSILKIEVFRNNLYIYKPFPIPVTGSIVRCLMFWDLSLDIEKDEIGVYNINGEKVTVREKITIEKLNSYSGHLVWDCSGFENGTYLIHIKHGTSTSTMKILINR